MFHALDSCLMFNFVSSQEAMGHIWKSLVDDPKRAVDAHFDLIIDDLLTQCGSRLWRVREASCFALADVIQGRKLEQVIFPN